MQYYITLLHTAFSNMPCERRVCLENRRRRQQHRRRANERRQVDHQAAQDNHEPPVNAAWNLAELQLQHAIANDPMVHRADQADLAQQNQYIDELPIQLPAPHRLGNMNNVCMHWASRY